MQRKINNRRPSDEKSQTETATRKFK